MYEGKKLHHLHSAIRYFCLIPKLSEKQILLNMQYFIGNAEFHVLPHFCLLEGKLNLNWTEETKVFLIFKKKKRKKKEQNPNLTTKQNNLMYCSLDMHSL